MRSVIVKCGVKAIESRRVRPKRGIMRSVIDNCVVTAIESRKIKFDDGLRSLDRESGFSEYELV